MKRIIIQIFMVVFAAIFSFNAAYAQPNSEKSVDMHFESEGLKTDAGKVVIEFHQAIQQGQKDKARGFLDDNVIIYEGGRVERSADDYANHHMYADMEYLADLDIEILEHSVRVLGSTAYSMSRTRLTGQYKGKAVNSEGMESMVLLKKEGGWKISHIHWSH